MLSVKRDRFIYRATLSYAVLASLWIFASDNVLAVFTDIQNIVWLSTAKGLVFVAVTTMLLYLGLQLVPATVTPTLAMAESQDTDGQYTLLQRLKKTALYVFAVAASLAMLWVHIRLERLALPADQPLVILFMFPIILSALLGGLGPGLAATLTCALGIAYWTMPPIDSLKISSPYDLFRWLLLCINGVLVSALSEGLRHAHQQSQRHHQELLRTTEQLRHSEDRLRLALDVAHSGTWEWRPGENSSYWSDQLWSLFGLAPGSVEPTLKGWLTTVHPDDLEAVQARLSLPLKPNDTYEIEWRVNTPPGVAARWILSRGQCIDRDDGLGPRYLGIMIDISDRKRAEAEIRRLNTNLEQHVLERTAELTAANRELDAFAYAVSHDLRAPLRAMSGMAQITIEDYAHLLPPEGRRYLDEIDNASRKMGELIDALLTLSRSTRGGIEFDTVDISGTARRVADELLQVEPQRAVSIQIEPGLTIRGDAHLLEVVMRNLLTNAWKYTARSALPSIRVYAEQQQQQRYICIADNGAGFDMAYANKLFQPFQRLHRQDEFPGVGIGLATVQRIIHRHGGTIDAQGTPGAGAVFRFTLPEAAVVYSAGLTELTAS